MSSRLYIILQGYVLQLIFVRRMLEDELGTSTLAGLLIK